MEPKIYNIRYSRIDLVERTSTLISIKEEEVFNFDIKAEGGADVGSNVLTIVVTIIVKTEDKRLLAKMVVAHSFEIGNLHEVSTFDENERKIPTDLDKILRTEAIATTRGLLFSELRGTYLHKAILPIIPPDSLKPVSKEKRNEIIN